MVDDTIRDLLLLIKKKKKGPPPGDDQKGNTGKYDSNMFLKKKVYQCTSRQV